MSWTDERIDRLKELWTQGMTASQIADELGGVSRNAVIGKAHRLGLQSRPSPVKPNEGPGETAPSPFEPEAPAQAKADSEARPKAAE
ncbi:MAG: GcrA family cell cycle regulator, partial [Allosphingosinicella sp.]